MVKMNDKGVDYNGEWSGGGGVCCAATKSGCLPNRPTGMLCSGIVIEAILQPLGKAQLAGNIEARRTEGGDEGAHGLEGYRLGGGGGGS